MGGQAVADFRQDSTIEDVMEDFQFVYDVTAILEFRVSSMHKHLLIDARRDHPQMLLLNRLLPRETSQGGAPKTGHLIRRETVFKL